MKYLYNILMIWIILIFIAPLYLLATGKVNLMMNWRTAPMNSSNIAPLPANYKGAIVQVYGARTFGWRGLFASHTWIAIKPKGVDHYTIYQYIGWNVYYNRPCLDIRAGVPDHYWFGQKPDLLFDLRGAKATQTIAQIKEAVKKYPYRYKYHAWPGPNSNTFIAYVVRHSPALKFAMPNNAVGKDFLIGRIFAKIPSKTGYQISLYNLLGIGFGKAEGLEINVLGLSFRFNLTKPYVHLPGVF